MMDNSEKGIDSVSLTVAIGIHILLLLFPTCSKPIEQGPYAGMYGIPVHLSGKSNKPQATEPIVEKALVKDDTSLRGKSKKDKNIQDKGGPKSLPGDRDAPAAFGQPKPIPPKIAINNEWKGTIILEVEVEPSGKMIGYKILQSTGYKELDEAFIKTVQSSYTFKPKRVLGKDETGTVTLSYTFDL